MDTGTAPQRADRQSFAASLGTLGTDPPTPSAARIRWTLEAVLSPRPPAAPRLVEEGTRT